MPREELTQDLPPTPQFIPPWTGGGDRDFNGHGPRVNLFTDLEVRNDNELWARVWMRARETQSDWTECAGRGEYLMFHNPEIVMIHRILSDPMSFHSYTDSDHERDVGDLSSSELVREYHVTGDTRGDEAGIRTGVTVHFNPVTLDVEREDTGVTTIDVNPTPEFVPQHVNGDREFAGHGPRVFVTTQISVRNGNEIWARLWMRARETQSDWTEARGSTNFMIHRHDRPIRSILSDTFSILSYVDTDHQVDEFNLTAEDLVQKFECVGDRRGDDAGAQTSVRVFFNPITILEA